MLLPQTQQLFSIAFANAHKQERAHSINLQQHLCSQSKILHGEVDTPCNTIPKLSNSILSCTTTTKTRKRVLGSVDAVSHFIGFQQKKFFAGSSVLAVLIQLGQEGYNPSKTVVSSSKTELIQLIPVFLGKNGVLRLARGDFGISLFLPRISVFLGKKPGLFVFLT
jgi:hypothetical protein